MLVSHARSVGAAGNRERLKARQCLVGFQARKQFSDGAGLPRQNRLRRNLGQWLQNKPTFLETRMRKRELRPLALLISEGNEIKIQRTRLVHDHLGLPAELHLKCL